MYAGAMLVKERGLGFTVCIGSYKEQGVDVERTGAETPKNKAFPFFAVHKIYPEGHTRRRGTSM